MKGRVFGLGTKGCAYLFCFLSLCPWGYVAWGVGEGQATGMTWVALERIIDAEATVPLQQVDVGRGLMYGIPVFLFGSGLTIVLTELFYAALRFFRGEV